MTVHVPTALTQAIEAYPLAVIPVMVLVVCLVTTWLVREIF